MKRILFFAAALFSAAYCHAQLPSLVKDVFPGTSSSTPHRLNVINDKLYYYAIDTVHGFELWEYSPGDPSTPKMVYDLWPGKSSSGMYTENDFMVSIGNSLYFKADSIGTSSQLFTNDGTGSRMVAKLKSGSSGAWPWALTTVGNKIFFIAASDTPSNNGLYSYDGINPPYPCRITPQVQSGMPANALVEYQNQLYFSNDSGNGKGRELYSLNPTTYQLKMVADIRPGSGWGSPFSWLNAWGKLYFAADDSAHGRELYSYDGTTVKRISDVAPGIASGVWAQNSRMQAYKRCIYFLGNTTGSTSSYTLYKCDTGTGIASVVTPAGVSIDYMYDAYPFTTFGNHLYFRGKTASAGLELYRYDGTTATRVTDLNPGAADGVERVKMAVYQNRLYFSGNNGVTGRELFRLDPTALGIESISWSGKVVAYPNPATSSATLSIALQSPQSIRVVLTDMQGREVWASAMRLLPVGKSEVNIPMEGLTTGQYFYRLNDDKGLLLAGGAVLMQQ